MALTLDIAANTRAAVSGVKDIGSELDRVGGALDDLARDAQRRGVTTENALGDIGRAGAESARDIDRAGEKIERTFADMVRDAKKADRAVKDVGDSGVRSFGKVREGAQEVTQEVGSNLGEAVSSIRGDMSDLGQVGQDTLGGLAATLAGSGPAGIAGAAALAAGAVGLGLITAELERQQEEADALRDRLSDAYSSAAEDGRTYLDTAQLIAEANSVMFDPDRADEWKRLQEDAKSLGMDAADIIAANAGDLEKQAEVQRGINALIDEQNNKPRQDGFMGTAEWDEQMGKLRGMRDRWEKVSEVTEDYAEKAKIAQRVTADLNDNSKAGFNDVKNAVDEQRRAVEKATEKAKQLERVKPPRIRLDVDDSAVRNYKPPTIRVPARIITPTGMRAFLD